MKIALVILHADPARGGAERYTVDLASALVQRGHDVTIVSSELLGLRGLAAGVTRTEQYVRFLQSVGRYLASNAFDVVHAMLPVMRCDIYHPHAGIALESVAQMSLLKRITNPRRVAMKNIERKLLTTEHSPIVLGLSNYLNEHVRLFYPSLPADRLARLFNAVDLKRFEPAPHPPREEVHALIIANDFERKGVPQAVQAVETIDDPRLILDIVGRGSVSSKHPSVRVHGQVADPREMYRSADFFLLPTRHDPCSLVVLEALAMGLPVISTKFNGATEIMTDGVHGRILSDQRNIPQLAAAIRELLDPPRRAAMSQACLELRPKLSYDHHLDQLIEIYQQSQSARS